jgi:hypothetical protein
MDEQRGWMTEHVLEAPRRRTLLWVFLAMTVVFGGSMAAVVAAVAPLTDVPVGVVAAAAVATGLTSGLSFSVTMTLLIAWSWSQQGGADQAVRIARAVKTGRVPDGADVSTWDPILARQEAWAGRGTWLFTLEFALFAGLSAFLLLLPPTPDDAPLPTWIPWAGLVFFGLVTVVSPFASLHRLRRVRVLRAELRRADRSL